MIDAPLASCLREATTLPAGLTPAAASRAGACIWPASRISIAPKMAYATGTAKVDSATVSVRLDRLETEVGYESRGGCNQQLTAAPHSPAPMHRPPA